VPRIRPALSALAVALPALLAPPSFAKPEKDLAERALVTLERGVKSGDFDIRALAIEGLGLAPKARAVGVVKDALKDPQWKVRSAAIGALKALKDNAWQAETALSVCDMAVDPATGIFPLIEGLGPSKGAELVVKALEAKDCPRPERYTKLFVLKGDAWTLAAMKVGLKVKTQTVRAAFEAELAALPFSVAPSVYKDAIAKYPLDLQRVIVSRLATDPAAADLKDLAFIKPLIKSTDADLVFRVSALLGARGDASGKAALVSALSSADLAARLTALRSLVKIADAQVFELMKDKIKADDTPYEELILAYEVYLGSGSKKLADYLENRLQDTNIDKRAAAVYFLARVKGVDALNDLHPFIVTKAARPIFLSACHAIGELAQRSSIPILRDALTRETDKDLKVVMLETLAKMKDIEVIPVASLYIRDRDPDVRRASVRALIAVPDASSAADLEIATRDMVKDIRELAFFALIEQAPVERLSMFDKSLEWLPPEALTTFVKKHGDNARPHLKLALTYKRDDLRATAWSLLGTLSKPVQLEVSKELLATNERQSLRLLAISRIVELEGKQAISTLEAFVKDSDDKVRVLIIASLGRLGHKDGIKALVDGLDDPSEHIRVAVAGAVLRL
jgi:HEAT repeat protein